MSESRCPQTTSTFLVPYFLQDMGQILESKEKPDIRFVGEVRRESRVYESSFGIYIRLIALSRGKPLPFCIIFAVGRIMKGIVTRSRMRKVYDAQDNFTSLSS